MEQIIAGIFVGGDKDYERVASREDFSVVRCCKFGPGGHKQILGYATQAAPDGPNKYWVEKDRLFALNMLDLAEPLKIPFEMVKKALDFAKTERDKGQKILFACNAGKSRGPSVAMMFLRSIGELPHPFMQSEKVFRTLYPKYDPGLGVRQFTRDRWRDLDNIESTNATG